MSASLEVAFASNLFPLTSNAFVHGPQITKEKPRATVT